MGTRGAFGFRLGGADKITYNHFDSYPEGLGDRVVADLKRIVERDGLGQLITDVAGLRLVQDGDTPTPTDIERCRRYSNLGVGEQKLSSWYCLLREAQPSHAGFVPMLELGVMIDSHEFMADSLFCEFAYVANLDDMVFEVYRGFQRAPHDRGRYAALTPDAPHRSQSYYGVALVKAFPIVDVAGWSETWAKECFPSEEDE